ncbi:uncharacterized protein LOC128270052 [Anopheles cruzii]|uniref:uncharacterized protein LOC128270052 n=1 Tax=Anopheles cruzii TaxID=68878 RepID=UPI0022EC6692|nr:uncharacterized protein LOC128270052 [Anopheles cruzii]
MSRARCCTLTFVLNYLKLNEPGDEHTKNPGKIFALSVQCGDSCVETSGTLDSLNQERPGNVVCFALTLFSVSGANCREKFIEFLTRNTIKLVLRDEKKICCTGTLRLWNYEVDQFDPVAVQLEFNLVDPQTLWPVGVGSVILQFSVDKPTVDQTSIMYVINDQADQGKPERTARRSTVVEALTCETCNGLRSTEELDLQYELVEGILHSKAMGSTERAILRIKEKVRGVVLDETIGRRDTFTPDESDDLGERCCNICGGLSVTGATCGAKETDAMGRQSSRSSRQPDSSVRPELCKRSEKKQTTANRYCDRCNACLNWLPDFCRCPKCGHKKSQAAEGGHHVRPSKYWAATEATLSSAERSASNSTASVTVVASSQSCPICHLRQGRCVDCSNEIEQRKQGASSDSELLEQQRSAARPVTRRPPLKDRQRTRTSSKRYSVEVREPTVQSERLARLRKAYAAQSPDSHPSDMAKAHPLTAAQIRKHHSKFLRKVGEQNRSRYSYRFGKRPSGIVAGHKGCMKQEVLVPPYMGWRWNIATLGIGKHRPGWRPGAVRKPIMMLMQHFLKCFPMDIVPVSTKTGCPLHGNRPPPADGDCWDEKGRQKPTLQVIKKHGEYCITMNPLRDSEALRTASKPQLPCKPITFKLSKDPRLTKLYKLRHALKQKSLTLCGCKQLENCNHRTEREKKLLGDEIRLAAKGLGLPADTTVADLPSESESEIDFDFTPPSAIIRVDVTKPDVVLTGTQYSQGDYEVTEPRVVPRETKARARSTPGAAPGSYIPKPIAAAGHPGGPKVTAGTKISKPAKAAESSSKTGAGPGKPVKPAEGSSKTVAEPTKSTKAGEGSRKPGTQSGADRKTNTPARKSVYFTGSAKPSTAPPPPRKSVTSIAQPATRKDQIAQGVKTKVAPKVPVPPRKPSKP